MPRKHTRNSSSSSSSNLIKDIKSSNSGNKRSRSSNSPNSPNNPNSPKRELSYEQEIDIYRKQFNRLKKRLIKNISDNETKGRNYTNFMIKILNGLKNVKTPRTLDNKSIFTYSYLDNFITQKHFDKIIHILEIIQKQYNSYRHIESDLLKFYLAKVLLKYIQECFYNTDGLKNSKECTYLKLAYYFTMIKNIIFDIDLKSILKQQIINVKILTTNIQLLKNLADTMPNSLPIKKQLNKLITTHEGVKQLKVTDNSEVAKKNIQIIVTSIQNEIKKELEKYIGIVRTATPYGDISTNNKKTTVENIKTIIQNIINCLQTQGLTTILINGYNVSLALEPDAIVIAIPKEGLPPKLYRLNYTNSGVFINPIDANGTVENYDFHFSFFNIEGGPYRDFVDCHITFKLTNSSTGDSIYFDRLFLRIPNNFSNQYITNITNLLHAISSHVNNQVNTSRVSRGFSASIIQKMKTKNNEMVKDFIKIFQFISFISKFTNTYPNCVPHTGGTRKTSKELIKHLKQ